MFPLTGGKRAVAIESLLDGCDQLNVNLADWARNHTAGSMWDLLSTCLIAQRRQPLTCFEIGTGLGRLSHHLALNTAAEARIYTLDNRTGGEVGSIFRDHASAGKITQLTGDSSSFDFRAWFGKIDLVYVDGDHHYEFVRRDTQTAFQLLAPGGCILWDDFSPSWPGVVKALRQHPQYRAMHLIGGTKVMCYLDQTRQ